MYSSSSAASSVIFQVYGDGQLLYQSPTLANGSAAVPIDVNVAGVKNLTLVVEAAPGSSASGDHAVWADARLISTANFGATQPYTLTWQLSQNGQVVSTQTAYSLVFTGLSGTYTLSLTVTDAGGNQGSASTTFNVVSETATAALGLKDSVTAGTGSATTAARATTSSGGPSSLPSYASITPLGANDYVWASITTDTRALQTPGGSSRIAATMVVRRRASRST